jgi:hypothetical protein
MVSETLRMVLWNCFETDGFAEDMRVQRSLSMAGRTLCRTRIPGDVMCAACRVMPFHWNAAQLTGCLHMRWCTCTKAPASSSFSTHGCHWSQQAPSREAPPSQHNTSGCMPAGSSRAKPAAPAAPPGSTWVRHSSQHCACSAALAAPPGSLQVPAALGVRGPSAWRMGARQILHSGCSRTSAACSLALSASPARTGTSSALQGNACCAHVQHQYRVLTLAALLCHPQTA